MRRKTVEMSETFEELMSLLRNFKKELSEGDLRAKVRALVPACRALREMGSSLVPREVASSARDRILYYFRKYPQSVVKGDEIMVVSGIQEWARRVRELRVQFGWSIVSGVTAKEMSREDEFPIDTIDVGVMGRDDYILLHPDQDREAAHRWNVANNIRRKKASVRDKILEFLRCNIGKPVTGEELRYVAKDRTEWARRVREARTEYGWPIVTKNTGRPDLPIGSYVLESDRQSPKHDRNIPDPLRCRVLQRDQYACRECGWSHSSWNRSDPRHLELHHIVHHAKGGETTEENLITLCTVCHDDIHRETSSRE